MTQDEDLRRSHDLVSILHWSAFLVYCTYYTTTPNTDAIFSIEFDRSQLQILGIVQSCFDQGFQNWSLHKKNLERYVFGYYAQQLAHEAHTPLDSRSYSLGQIGWKIWRAHQVFLQSPFESVSFGRRGIAQKLTISEGWGCHSVSCSNGAHLHQYNRSEHCWTLEDAGQVIICHESKCPRIRTVYRSTSLTRIK